ALPAISRVANAQAYPAHPVRLIVPVPAAGALDILARHVGHGLTEHMGRPFVVENRPGAGTNIGIEAVVRSPADGYTLLLIPGSGRAHCPLNKKLPRTFV